MPPRSSIILKPGTIISHRFELKAILDSGSFGSVYTALDMSTGNTIALKLSDRRHDGVFLAEARVQAFLTSRRFAPAPTLHATGVTPDYSFIAMKLLGPSVKHYAKMGMTSKSVLGMGQHMMRVVAALHTTGIIHRDIKPSNFALSASSVLYLLDYGIARRFVDRNGQLGIPRQKPGVRHPPHPNPRLTQFRGSSRYASVRAHAGEELSPRDDAWSTVFSIIELWLGELPWSKAPTTEDVVRIKNDVISGRAGVELPQCIWICIAHIETLQYGEQMDADLIDAAFKADIGQLPDEVLDDNTASGAPQGNRNVVTVNDHTQARFRQRLGLPGVIGFGIASLAQKVVGSVADFTIGI